MLQSASSSIIWAAIAACFALCCVGTAGAEEPGTRRKPGNIFLPDRVILASSAARPTRQATIRAAGAAHTAVSRGHSQVPEVRPIPYLVAGLVPAAVPATRLGSEAFQAGPRKTLRGFLQHLREEEEKDAQEEAALSAELDPDDSKSELGDPSEAPPAEERDPMGAEVVEEQVIGEGYRIQQMEPALPYPRTPGMRSDQFLLLMPIDLEALSGDPAYLQVPLEQNFEPPASGLRSQINMTKEP